MSYVRKTIENMAGYTPGEQVNRKVIKLNTNENPYPPSPNVETALKNIALEKLRLYPNPTANPLRHKASEVYNVPVDRIIAGNGSDDLLTMIFRVFLEPGDTVTTFYPTYTLYETLAELQDATLRYVDLTDKFDVPKGFSDQTSKFVILANPNSPTGTMVEPNRVKQIAKNIPGVLVVDEAYAEFASQDCLELARTMDNVMVLRTFSKSFSMAGVRLGLGFGCPDLINQLMKVKDSYNVNRLSIQAGIAALEDMDWMQKNRQKILSTRQTLLSQLSEIGLEPVASESNFVFVRCSDPDAKTLYENLRENSILVRFFDRERTRNYLRITVGTDQQIHKLIETLTELLPD